MAGYKHDFDNATIIRTEIVPGGGPPLHTHRADEVHVLPMGSLAYTIGDEQFEVTGPYVLCIPAHMSHTCTNIGGTTITLICFRRNCEEIGHTPPRA